MRTVKGMTGHDVMSQDGLLPFKTFKVSETDSCSMWMSELMGEYLTGAFIQTQMKTSKNQKTLIKMKDKTKLAAASTKTAKTFKSAKSAKSAKTVLKNKNKIQSKLDKKSAAKLFDSWTFMNFGSAKKQFKPQFY